MVIPETFGLSKSARLSDPYITPGDRAFVVGAQDGAFPDMGWHVRGEMGGVWAPPLKLLDGFWLQVDGTWLGGAELFSVTDHTTVQRYSLPSQIQVLRTQYALDGLPVVVVRFDFTTPEAKRLSLRFLARSDLQLVWDSDPPGFVKAADVATYSPSLNAWSVTNGDRANCTLIGARGAAPVATSSGIDLWGPEETAGHGISVALDYTLDVAGHGSTSLEIVICGGIDGIVSTEETFRRALSDSPVLARRKAVRYANLRSRSVLDVTDASIARAWDWVKINCDWLVLEVPDVGRGMVAGAQDYMWWFGCDSAYAVLGALAFGQHESAISTLDLVRERSARANTAFGRVLHECTTLGKVVHPGCTQETPHFVQAVWQVYSWTGDATFLERSYEFCKQGLLDWILQACCRDGELLPYGYGITETDGLDLQCIDSAAHTVMALDALANMGAVMGDDEVHTRCTSLATNARREMEERFWLDDEGLYADMLATPQEMVQRVREWIAETEAREFTQGRQTDVLSALNGLLLAAEGSPEPLRKRGWSLKYWAVIAPVEEGIALSSRAESVLDRMAGQQFSGPHGMYLSGIDHTHAMSVNTGALAVANMQYRRPDEALRLIRLMTDTLAVHMPGAVSEMLPDYGCFVQAWSGYAVAWPVVAFMFGLTPNAAARKLVVNACMPTEWREAALSNVLIGGAHFDFHWRDGTMQVWCDDDSWEITSPMNSLSFQGPRSAASSAQARL